MLEMDQVRVGSQGAVVPTEVLQAQLPRHVASQMIVLDVVRLKGTEWSRG